MIYQETWTSIRILERKKIPDSIRRNILERYVLVNSDLSEVKLNLTSCITILL